MLMCLHSTFYFGCFAVDGRQKCIKNYVHTVDSLWMCMAPLRSFMRAIAYVFMGFLGVRTSELFLCFVAVVRVRAIVLTSLLSLFYVTGEFHRFLHRGRAVFMAAILVFQNKQGDTPTVVQGGEGGGGETPPSIFFVLYKQNKINLQ